MSDPAHFWHNPTAVRIVALLAVGLFVTTIWLFRRQKRSGRGAAIVCLILSVGLHVALIAFVPKLSMFFGGAGDAQPTVAPENEPMPVAVFAPDSDDDLSSDSMLGEQPLSDSYEADDSPISPLTLAEPIVELQTPVVAMAEPEPASDAVEIIEAAKSQIVTSLASIKRDASPDHSTDLDDVLGDWISETLAPPDAPQPTTSSEPDRPIESSVAMPAGKRQTEDRSDEDEVIRAAGSPIIDEDFASRLGNAKKIALSSTGGDASTEASVAAALKFLSQTQRPDGAWDPIATGAGRERAPLGLTRGSAGRRAATGITGLALLSMLGAGNTHQSGDYRENVYRGLAYLLGRQRSDGSLAGDASVYAAHYCHAMAALAIAEAAVMTGDPAALEATRRAIAYSRSTQHPSTGGWRYTRGDRGDLSQLGWQAMLIDAAVRSGAIDPPTSMQAGVARFLDSVRSGSAGGLASYRPGEGPTATMTAEALATRLLIGQEVPDATIRETESVLLAELPGNDRENASGLDNYYYWYYATLALHQLQDDAWNQWNAALKKRLLSTQRPDGSWSDSTLWGGYGGTIYSTSMATLCLESYYRHTVSQRSDASQRSNSNVSHRTP
ncbi:prenyltransferase/squalene oxidase repeat-containing protein [Neorhodopirellula pilleata]|uniref:Prenyltransferase and squalene oxidase repeat protein n=1 Tax=Neorhodopirellula pilleata TaxID=2714738 RepID=A0A5C6AU31_9BACT|nr:prenyltransferase/squalene oxidase repeat-containing protein [Neorhodopirellula pilleata]TWU01664.1 Prenyltransferase and squalene oxidase repeat protein [Neorhodopirellula pilleata]